MYSTNSIAKGMRSSNAHANNLCGAVQNRMLDNNLSNIPKKRGALTDCNSHTYLRRAITIFGYHHPSEEWTLQKMSFKVVLLAKKTDHQNQSRKRTSAMQEEALAMD